MDIRIQHESFTIRALTVRSAGFWSGPKLLLDGVDVKGKRSEFQVPDNTGTTRKIKINSSFFDPIPKVEIDGEAIELARSLTWYEYVWMGIPILLVFAGGGIGALFGLTAVYSSARIFRSERTTTAKYILSGLTSLAAVAAWLFVAVAVQLMVDDTPAQ